MGRLREYQLEMLEVLKEFARICKENDIQWWLCSGTLLGAARHGGFIPWDDDMDVSMLKKDYRKLVKVMKKMEGSEYFYQCMQTDVEHINPFGKFLRKEGNCNNADKRSKYFKYHGPGLDVFCIEPSSRFASHLAKFFYMNLQHPTMYIKCKWLRHFCIRLVELLNFGLLIPLCRLIGLVNPKKQYHYLLGSGFYGSAFYPKDIFPLKTMSFEGVEFPVPGNTDAYLSTIYGDWHKIPPKEKIIEGLHNPDYIQELFAE